jgi:hypothetical protein
MVDFANDGKVGERPRQMQQQTRPTERRNQSTFGELQRVTCHHLVGIAHRHAIARQRPDLNERDELRNKQNQRATKTSKRSQLKMKMKTGNNNIKN